MNKEQTISFIETQIAEGKISREEVIAAAHKSEGGHKKDAHDVSRSVASASSAQPFGIVNALYIIGALIVLIGVVILIWQHWVGIGFFGRVIVTLGISCVTYVWGLMVRKSPQYMIFQVLFVISAALTPIGVHVIFVQAGVDFSAFYQVLTALVLLLVYALVYSVTKKSVLVLIMTAFGSWAYYAFLANILTSDPYGGSWLKWATMLLGLSYILIGYGYQMYRGNGRHVSGGRPSAVTSVLYGFGTLGVLGAAMSFGNGIWDLILIALIFGAFYASVYLRSRIVLLLASLFLVVHLIRLTQRYFLNSIGWSVSLIISGFLVIAIAYLTFYLNNKFFKEKATY